MRKLKLPQMAEQAYAAPNVLVANFAAGAVTDWRAADNPRGASAPTGRDTVFRIASMSKSFLAAAALALRDEGLLDFRCSIATYVPGVRFVLGKREYEVSIEDMLSNRSGMPEDNAWGDRQLGASPEWIAELGREGFKLTSRPGERYQYSNVGMSLVGRAIEHVTGRTVEEEIERRFLIPLGLTSTRYRVEEYPADTNIAEGYRSFDEGETFVPEPYVGSGALACIGGLFSTVNDIAKWAGFLAAAFSVDADDTTEEATPAPLSARSRREMQRIHTPNAISGDTSGRALDARGYGLGLVSELDREHGAIVSHSGGLPGFTSHMRWHIPSGTGVVVFGNSDAFSASRLAVTELSERLARTALKPRWQAPWPETLAAADHIDEVLRSGESLAHIADVVASNFFLDVPVEVRDRRLSAQRAELGELRTTTPLGERIIASSDDTDIASKLRWRISFEEGDLECEMWLVGLQTPSVQGLTISKA